ncbi:hypothetical protein [Collimonas humicola]|uniref:hypothetical protein n=1 Tax=Collimonas humicola TaxID=2825886 RepID=UPI001B8B93B2|nr:hypothetical protein [Collimonas humicola]
MAVMELRDIQKQMAEATAQVSLSHTDAESRQRQAEEARRMVVKIRVAQKMTRPTRKPKAESATQRLVKLYPVKQLMPETT